jgi:hypothetical protein
MAEESKAELSGEKGNGKNKFQTYATTAEYFTALEKWLHDVYMWQSIAASFPYALMTNQFATTGAINMQNFGGNQSGTGVFPYMTILQNTDVLHNRRPQVATVRPTQHRQHAVSEEG